MPAQAMTYARTHGAEVISNSWAYPMPCWYASSYYDVLTEAIEDAVTLGRGGLGCPVIFSAGNFSPGMPGVAYPGCLPTVLSVGAIHLDDQPWDYSCYGDELDLVAPSGMKSKQGDVWTLDQMGAYGSNPVYFNDCPPVGSDPNYDCHFGGTSPPLR